MLPRLLFLLGIACLATGAWLYYESLPPPPCEIEQPEREVAAVAGQEQDVIFRITNPSNNVVKIVGLADC